MRIRRNCRHSKEESGHERETSLIGLGSDIIREGRTPAGISFPRLWVASYTAPRIKRGR